MAREKRKFTYITSDLHKEVVKIITKDKVKYRNIADFVGKAVKEKIDQEKEK